MTIATYRMQPVYDATARIEIDRENTSVLPFSGSGPGGDAYDEDLEQYIETQSRILTSATMAEQTIKSLHLDQDPRFGGHPNTAATLAVAPAATGAQTAPAALGAFLGACPFGGCRIHAFWT